MTKKKSPSAAALTIGVLALALVAATPAAAQGGLLSGLEIHGFGGWAYAETDGLSYGLGDSDGRYDNAEFALNVSAHPSDRLSLVAQVYFESNDDDANDEKDAELDYVFAEWFVSDALKLRIGRVKHPFGIYGEVFDVGTLRPFYLLPQSIYGPNGFTAKAYNGAGITGRHTWSSDWGLQYDLYVGEIEGDFEIPGLLTTVDELFAEPNVSLGFTVEDTIGARLNLLTPIDGLTVGVSAYSGDETVGIDIITPNTRDTYLGHVEYLGDRWAARAEWGTLEHKDSFDQEGGYLEMSYKVTDHWELAVRGEDWELEYPGIDFSTLPPILPRLMEHQDLGFGVSYWFSPSFVVRLNVHETDGNRFAFVDTPEEVLAALTTGELDDQTELIILGAQFSF